jgi:DNA ligase (NAD+)
MLFIAELNARLQENRQAYYAGLSHLPDGRPVLTDAEYDVEEEELKGLVKAYPDYAYLATVLTTVGTDEIPSTPASDDSIIVAPAASASGRIAHRVPMLSLENYYTIKEVCAWAESLGWPTLSVGSKLDGVSDSLVYEAGPITHALTRGDGASGENVLSQIMAAGAAPATISTYAPFGGRVEIRGEVVISQPKFRELNAQLEADGKDPYAAARGLAAGTLKLLDLEEVKRRGIQFRPWDVLLPAGALPDSGVERLREIVAFGFAPSDDRIVTNRTELIAAIEELLLTLQDDGQEIGKDGIVIKVDSHELREKLGRGSRFTNHQICFKPQNQKAETVVESVSWQVGRTGRVTPVANVKPVILGGVQIARAMLNNFGWLMALGMRSGSRVALVRSGDVIPKITEVLDNPPDSTAVVAPTNCPNCSSVLVYHKEEDSMTMMHWCENDKCVGRVRDYLTYIADRTVLEIDGLGPELAGKLVEAGLVKSLSTALSDLFQFQTDTKNLIVLAGQSAAEAKLLEMGLPVSLTFRMIESIDRARSAPWPVWIAAMAIPMIGRRLGKVLAKELKLQPDDLPKLPAIIASATVSDIDGFGVVKTGELLRYAENPTWIRLCAALYDEGVRPAAIVSAGNGGPKPLEGVYFLITGEFADIGTRDDIKVRLEARGAVAKSGVTKNLTHLIVGTVPGKSKLDKAEQLGIQQVGVEWLQQALA